MKQLLIFPYNGNGIEALDCLQGQYELIGFVDDNPEKQGIQANGVEVFSRAALTRYKDAKVLAVPGSPTTYTQRRAMIEGLQVPDNRFATVIHSNAQVSRLARIGHNVLIMAGVVITSNAVLGNHLCILPNTVIHHDVQIHDYTLIGAQIVIAGYTTVGRDCYIGSGSKVIDHITIGDSTLVGMGTNVITSIPARHKVVGNPARIIGIVS
ncbi:MAG: NeuD/PglB/VioB family sugar acetyltransferase [Lentisphaerae bacterium]|nr:NeuD/PglB/VioB family sugar acetyltransferase [Lentisphaerota bacterium]